MPHNPEDTRRINLVLTPDEMLRRDHAIRHQLPQGLTHFRVLRESLDARRKKVRFQLVVEASKAPLPDLLVPPPPPPASSGRPVVVVGAGPAGLLAAYSLVQQGLAPVVVDRGAAFPDRHLQVRDLRLHGAWRGSPALTCGLGGAGTYSDGKLYTRKKSRHVRTALQLMAWFGSSREVLVDSHPHVGSNQLPRLVQRLRDHLEAHGARFLFNATVTELAVRQGRVTGVRLAGGDVVEGEAVVLAPGNNARGLFAALHGQQVAMEPKAFAVGARVEHPRDLIDRCQYGTLAGHPALGAARYAFAWSDVPRAVYTFCMCPGGHVIPTPPEEGHLAVNGMSFSTRSSRWSNAALVVAVAPEDWAADDGGALGGIGWQRALETRCFEAAGGGYHAPAQRLTDFVAGRESTSLPELSYRPGGVSADVAALLPPAVTDAMRSAAQRADKVLRGYLTREAAIIAPETLTSSPVRLLRTPTGESASHPGLFPCGEGSGWAGGITSSAADGLRAGEAVALSLGFPGDQ